MNKVLVIGGTGVVGSLVVEMLQKSSNFDVYLMVKDNQESLEKARNLVFDSQIIKGDLTDPNSIGMIAVNYIVATAAAYDSSMNDGYEKVFDIAAKTGVQQIVFVSNRSEDGDQMIPMLAAKTAIHIALRRSLVPHTILMFDAFVGTMKSIIDMSLMYFGKFPIYTDEGMTEDEFGKHYWITEEQVAEVTAGMVANRHAFNKTLHIGGPESYSVLEFANRYAVERGEKIPTEILSTPLPGHEAFFDLLRNIQQYTSPIPDDVSPFGM